MTENDNSIKITGTVENITFTNPENGYTVFDMNSGGELVTAVGNVSDLTSGEEITLCGVWKNHRTFGRQFVFTGCVRSLPDTAQKLFRYLASGAIKGIGPKTAAKIIGRFGDDTFRVLESDPDRLAEIPGISKKKAVELCDEFNKKYAMRKIMLEFETYGISPGECASIYKYFGLNAYETIRNNPYILCGTVNGFGFERAENLVRSMGVTPEARFRNAAGVLFILRHNLSNGHTCLPLSKMGSPCAELLGITPEETAETIENLVNTRQIAEFEKNGEEFIALPDLYRAEKFIADRIRLAVRFTPSNSRETDGDIKLIERRNGIEYAEKQKLAIKTAIEKGVLILTGGPGTGKTTTLKGIIEIFDRNGIETKLAAPTGRAAKRLSEVTGVEAQTLHRLLEVEWDETDKPVFRRDSQNPLTAGAVIVDEMSMVDAELFSSLLDALPLGCRIILVGDSDQLPSVGPGNVLNDLILSELMPVVSLTEIFRQAQRSLIVMNAHRIITGGMPELGAKDNDFFFISREDPVSARETVAELISKRLPNAYGYSPFDDIQVLCPSRKGDCGTVNLNARLQEVLNPPAPVKNELKTVSRVFREGDRVMQIKNNYNIPWTRGREEGMGIFNGDIGLLRRINYAEGTMTIEFDDRIAKYPADNLSELESAFAVTVHKSQGSEYPVVIIPVCDCPNMLRYRNLLYTAVTRAKKLLILVGREELIESMVGNDRQNRRYSALYDFIMQK